MNELLLTFNLGSATLRVAAFALAAPETALFRLTVDLGSGQVHTRGEVPPALQQALAPGLDPTDIAMLAGSHAARDGQRVVCMAHRIVHGGRHHTPRWVDEALLQELEDLEARCPLHQPAALELLWHVRSLWPAIPQVAVFDTAFHAHQPALATTYALPAALRVQGLVAHGFHGISCQHVLRTLQQAQPALVAGRVLIAHLGHGASMTAVQGGTSVATSMGFSTLEGLPMATRVGRLDPGVLLYLLEQGWNKSRLTDLLYHQSGLAGLSGLSGDMRELIASHGEPARFAVEYFCYWAARTAASLVCAMGGLDALVFTGGVGEHQPLVREKICRRLAWLGVELDDGANLVGHGALSTAASRCRILVLPCDEEAELSRQSVALMAREQPPAALAQAG